MKLVYRIVTPILAVGAVALGIFLKLFTFVVGSQDEQINNLVNAVSNLFDKVNTTYEYSLFEIIKMTAKGVPNPDPELSFTEVIKPIFGDIIAFAVLFALILLVLLAIAVVAALANNKKKRLIVICMSAFDLVLSIAAIVVSNDAFQKIINGDVNLTNLVKMLSDNVLVTLATVIVSVTSATLSAGFYAVFGMLILIILWTILSNFIIKTPIQAKKTYHRKKPRRQIIKAKKEK